MLSEKMADWRIIMKKEETKIVDLYDLSHTQAADFLRQFTYPWEALAHIKEFILELGKTLPEDEYEKRGETVWVHKTAKVMPSAYLGENIIIGKDTEVRHCAFLRGNALVGEGAVVGNSTELKNVILFDKVQVPHYNYVGDSILGYRAHMGAGSITSNVKSDKLLVKVHAEDGDIETGINRMRFCSESRNRYWKELQYLPAIQRPWMCGREFHL